MTPTQKAALECGTATPAVQAEAAALIVKLEAENTRLRGTKTRVREAQLAAENGQLRFELVALEKSLRADYQRVAEELVRVRAELAEATDARDMARQGWKDDQDKLATAHELLKRCAAQGLGTLTDEIMAYLAAQPAAPEGDSWEDRARQAEALHEDMREQARQLRAELDAVWAVVNTGARGLTTLADIVATKLNRTRELEQAVYDSGVARDAAESRHAAERAALVERAERAEDDVQKLRRALINQTNDTVRNEVHTHLQEAQRLTLYERERAESERNALAATLERVREAYAARHYDGVYGFSFVVAIGEALAGAPVAPRSEPEGDEK